MTMTSEDGDILSLLSERSLKEEQLEVSRSDDIFPAILEAIKSDEKTVELSPEEAAWADSCFVQTTELADDDWAAMRDALLDVLETPTESTYDTLEGVHDLGIHAVSEAKHRSFYTEKSSQHNDVHLEQISNSDDDKDNTEACEDIILGADEHDNQMDSYAVETEDGNKLASSEILEQTESTHSIFKVWDLKVSFSDDDSELELIKDLKKLLKDSPLVDVYPALPPGDAANPLSQISINELVAGLSDLSIQQTNE